MTIKEKAARREFLNSLAGGAAIMTASILPAPISAKTPMWEEADPSSPEAWVNKIKGKHRVVFDSTWQHKGFPFAWAKVFSLTNNETGTPDSQLGTVVVLRHDAIPFAMENSLWEKYKFGEMFKVEDPQTKMPSVRNIYYKPAKGELLFDDMSIDELMKKGVMFCVCQMAISVYSGFYAKEHGADAEAVKKEWSAGILPGIQPVPSGVWALNRCQEKGCSYIFAG